jgi:hypothetical protein
MKRLRRWFFNGTAAVSLGLCLAAMACSFDSAANGTWRVLCLRTPGGLVCRCYATDIGVIASCLHPWPVSSTSSFGISYRQGYLVTPSSVGLVWLKNPYMAVRGDFYFMSGRATFTIPPPQWDSPVIFVGNALHPPGPFQGNLSLWNLRAPYWFVILIFAILPLVWALSAARHLRRANTSGAFCVECGYDLRATPERCPECGTVPPKTEISK